MDTSSFREACAEYLLGQLEGEERALFEAELSARGEDGDQILRAEAELLGDLALAADPVPPPPGLRERLLSEIRSAGNPTEIIHSDSGPSAETSTHLRISPAASPLEPGLPRGWQAALATAAILVLALGIWNLELRSTVSEQRTALEAAERGLAVLDSLEASLRVAREDFGTLASPAASVVQLAGTEDRPEARARVFVDPESGRALVLAYDLPVLPPEQVYQLWALRDGVPASVGTFAARAEAAARLELDNLEAVAGADLFAVTVEPAPGQPSPTGAMVLISGN